MNHGWSHSPQCAECDRVGRGAVRGRVRRRRAPQNSAIEVSRTQALVLIGRPPRCATTLLRSGSSRVVMLGFSFYRSVCSQFSLGDAQRSLREKMRSSNETPRVDYTRLYIFGSEQDHIYQVWQVASFTWRRCRSTLSLRTMPPNQKGNPTNKKSVVTHGRGADDRDQSARRKVRRCWRRQHPHTLPTSNFTRLILWSGWARCLSQVTFVFLSAAAPRGTRN